MPKRYVYAPIVIALSTVVSGEAVHAQSYTPGFEWNRLSDWKPGPVPGLPTGNPAPDKQGSNVYSYEWTFGDGLGSSFEWFENPGVPLVWDDTWFGGSQSAWTRANDTNPPIFKNRLTHNLIGENHDFIPAVRWQNPVAGGTSLNITGSLTVLWSGNNFVGAPTDVDVVISIIDPNPESTQRVLFAQTVSKPNPGLTVGDIVELEINLTEVQIDDSAIISLSLRGHEKMTGEGRWVVLYDHELNMSIVPAPGAIALAFGVPMFALARRRRS